MLAELVILVVVFLLFSGVFLKAGVVAGTFLKLEVTPGFFFGGVDSGVDYGYLAVFERIMGNLGDLCVCNFPGVFIPEGIFLNEGCGVCCLVWISPQPWGWWMWGSLCLLGGLECSLWLECSFWLECSSTLVSSSASSLGELMVMECPVGA